MTRDRLAELIATDVDRDENSFVDVQIDADGIIGNFLAEVEQISELIEQIKLNVRDVKNLHNSILTSPQTDNKTKQDLEDHMSEIKKTSDEIRTKLKNVEQKIEKDASFGANVRIMKTQHSTLLIVFVEIVSDYNQIQNDYRERCKGRIKRQLELTGRSLTIVNIEDMLEHGNVALFTEGIVTETKHERERLADIEARHSDIIKLETSIKELHSLFVDMNTLVDFQGEMIDNIANHVDQSVNYVQEATEDTKMAKIYRRKSNKKKFLMIVICHTILGIIIILLLTLL